MNTSTRPDRGVSGWRYDVLAEVAAEMLETLQALTLAGAVLPCPDGALDRWADLLRDTDPLMTWIYDGIAAEETGGGTPKDTT